MPPARPVQGRRQIAIAIELSFLLPWHYGCLKGIRLYGQQHGWACVLDPFLVGMGTRRSVSDYDGVVGRINARMADVAHEHGLPVVNHHLNSNARDVPSICPDWYTGTRLAGEHLMACGYRRFGYVGFQGGLESPDHRGFADAVTSRGFPPPEVCAIPAGYEKGPAEMTAMREIVGAWLAACTPPIGLVTYDSVVARYVVQTCLELGLRIPHDVAVVANGGEWVAVSGATPTISSIEHDYQDVGYKAAAMLDRLMAGESVEPIRQLLPPRRLIVRDSSDIFLSSDPLVSEAMRFIANHARQTLHIDEIAAALKTSKRTLQRRFDQTLGRSLTDEINRLRTEQIQRVLIDSDLSIAKIAATYGFGSASQFTQFFKRQTGISPTEYRQQWQDGKSSSDAS